ncbi:domain found in IF2B/IF5-domain-containing protein [Auriculariales sp. MPI-PUGE-AT-0066]|nr:domain found in IF2B/IF5-domain-containing protein [Auriculariales sp. MPI-PUGE-AT-0066]
MASGGIVNIRRDVDDKFYRYRMPLLLTKIEGKGNGIKTVVPNMADVAKALSRPATYPTKFFGCELGAQTTFDEKAERYIVNGAHQAGRLRELLDSFIDKFVLCGACKNPETELIITKSDDIIRDCKACGQRTNVDMRHKLTTFILKNPPKKSAKKGRGINADSSTGAGPAQIAGDSPAGGSGEEEDGSGDELSKRIAKEAATMGEPTADDTFQTDTSAEAMQSMVLGGDDDDEEGEDVNSPYAQLGVWIEENHEDTNGVEVFRKIQELGIEKKHKTVQVVVQALFTDKMLTEFPAYGPMFKKLVTSEKHQKSLLGGTERLVGINYPDLVSAVPKILMAYYQADILEEEVIKQWGTHVSKKYVDRETSKRVRKASEPFLKWLEEADDDEEDDE